MDSINHYEEQPTNPAQAFNEVMVVGTHNRLKKEMERTIGKLLVREYHLVKVLKDLRQAALDYWGACPSFANRVSADEAARVTMALRNALNATEAIPK